MTKFQNEYALGMIVPGGGQHVEIIGTNVIPEFSEYVGFVFLMGLLPMILLLKKFRSQLYASST